MDCSCSLMTTWRTFTRNRNSHSHTERPRGTILPKDTLTRRRARDQTAYLMNSWQPTLPPEPQEPMTPFFMLEMTDLNNIDASCFKILVLLKEKKQQASEKRIQGWCHICYILTNCNNICIKSFSVSGLSLNRPVSEISWIVVGGVSPCWWRKCCPIRGPVLTRWLASGGQ